MAREVGREAAVCVSSGFALWLRGGVMQCDSSKVNVLVGFAVFDLVVMQC